MSNNNSTSVSVIRKTWNVIQDMCLNAAFAICMIFTAIAIVVVGTYFGNKVYNNVYGEYRTPTSSDAFTTELTDAVYSLDKLLSK